MSKAFRTLVHCLLVVAGLGALGTVAEAGDISVFASRARPSAAWGDGYGATLGSTWFRVVTFEGEVARLPGELPDSGMTSFTGAALLSLPLPIFTPYAGVGVGIFRQTVAADDDMGTLKAVIVGAKVTVGLAVLRADYRKLTLSGTPLVGIDSRLSAGIGLSF
jgi:hypothetical protein